MYDLENAMNGTEQDQRAPGGVRSAPCPLRPAQELALDRLSRSAYMHALTLSETAANAGSNVFPTLPPWKMALRHTSQVDDDRLLGTRTGVRSAPGASRFWGGTSDHAREALQRIQKDVLLKSSR